jgi:hypothetical protein
MPTIVAKHVVGQYITREAAMYVIMLAAVVFGAAIVNGSVLVARRAAEALISDCGGSSDAREGRRAFSR